MAFFSFVAVGIFLETHNTDFLKISYPLMRNNYFVLLKTAIDISLLMNADAFNTSETNDELLQTHSAEHANMSSYSDIAAGEDNVLTSLKKGTLFDYLTLHSFCS